ncbi:MAG: helix-hairpin-helix domain-containing protein [Sulfurovum sp.]|nr:helix-hairpin-helix domain-containing protein [Sulfurovum sp.]
MKRYDLRHLHDDFYDRMAELIDQGLKVGEVGIFLFEVGDFSHIQKSADFIKELGHDLMNSLKFNEVDWTIVVKKLDEETRRSRAEVVAAARAEAERKAAEEAAAAEEKAKAEAKAAEEKAKAEAEAKAKEEAEAKAKAEAEAKAKAEEEAKAKAEAEAKAKEESGKKSQKEEASKGDDLTKIKGIGKVYMEKLNSEGIYTYEDVANMTEEQIQMMEEKYSFKGDFKESVADAKKLVKAKAK